MAEQKRDGETALHDHPRAEVQAHLDRMAKALTAGDGAAIARMWEVPTVVIGDDQVMAVGSLEEVEQFFGGAKEQYNERGITDTRADIVDLRWTTDRIAIVEVRWPYIDAQGKAKGEETSTYTLRRGDDGELKMRAVVMHGASA